ncbi:Uroporphyrinogen-III synthase [Hahella chejuensis KCTC 2396]|uniref:Uroporphyrinogen-III synthase n=1 Tax=Hahella chejuensis (strain KCTC 2396) TaxID=349521 RepID=Q2SQ71_HAHCH|nr:uroporphyrinogen-III synthase [Hahella chejuensis]ABC27203.1 Uroporphyrinogen-III synthase [Hahella chejuensis KCTC 2396]
METTLSQELSGLRVLLTRPQGENDSLRALLEQNSAEVRVLPAIAIEPLPETQAIKDCILDLDRYTHVICVSKHASRLLLELIDAYWPQAPQGVRWFAIGESSAAPLRSYGLTVNTPEQGCASEQLLEHPGLQARNEDEPPMRVLIVKGCGGRELLTETMQERGAHVATLELYERKTLEYDPNELNEALKQWRPEVVVTLSGETLLHLCQLGQNIGYAWGDTLFVIPSARVATLAQENRLNYKIAPELSDEALLALLKTAC